MQNHIWENVMYTLVLYWAECVAYAHDYEKVPRSVYRVMNVLDIALIAAVVIGVIY